MITLGIEIASFSFFQQLTLGNIRLFFFFFSPKFHSCVLPFPMSLMFSWRNKTSDSTFGPVNLTDVQLQPEPVLNTVHT